ncbi:MAG: YaaR family protein [Halanaerobiales bacterium]|nr:YaaR family protein [Halanaerobiales bacterium]
MKIENRDVNSRARINRESSEKKVGSPTSTEKSFQSQLEDIKQEEIKERFDKLLNLVDKQGDKLKKSLDKKDLKEYKKRVKDILRLIQNEFAQTKQSFSWDGTGNLKIYTIIEKVDQNLDILHNLFLQEQADVLEVVKKIDEIRGLLLDLYI